MCRDGFYGPTPRGITTRETDIDNNQCFCVGATVSEDRVTLTITVMDLSLHWYHDSQECPFYRIEVRDGDNAGAPLIGTYCRSRAPPHLTTQGSAMFVQAMSLYGGQIGTFSAVYSVLSSGKFQHVNLLTIFKNGSVCLASYRIICCPENFPFVQQINTFHNM